MVWKEKGLLGIGKQIDSVNECLERRDIDIGHARRMVYAKINEGDLEGGIFWV